MSTNSTALLSDLIERLRKRGQTLPAPAGSALEGLRGGKADFFSRAEGDGANENDARALMIEYARFRMEQQARYCQ